MKTASACLAFLKQGRKDRHDCENGFLKYYFGSVIKREGHSLMKASHKNLSPKGDLLVT